MAVFTKISAESLGVIIENYGIGPVVSFVGLFDGDNESTYILMSDKREFLVTLFESNIDPFDLERAFKTMETLRAAGVPCPETIRTLSGKSSVLLADKLLAIVSVVPGHKDHDLSAERANSLGRNIALIHKVLLSQAPVRWATRAGLVRGWLHGAITPDNVFFLQSSVSGIINFRMRHEGFLIEEVAEAIAFWMIPGAHANSLLIRSLLAGYHELRPIEQHEMHQLPHFVVAALIRSRSEAQNQVVPTFDELGVIYASVLEASDAAR